MKIATSVLATVLTLAAATLPARYALGLGLLAIACSILLAFFHMPVPTLMGAPAVPEPSPEVLTVMVLARVLQAVSEATNAGRSPASSLRLTSYSPRHRNGPTSRKPALKASV